VLLDRDMIGAVDRLSPEAPVPIVARTHTTGRTAPDWQPS
jgi:D-beta-D-heptose 7-phosphate kinase/D-beta-D-heptose 1-phosphate adenosyltransferase